MNRAFTKRVLCILLVVCTCFMMAACEDKDKEEEEVIEPGTVTEVTVITPDEYENLPDETVYNEDGGVVATGKDLVTYNSVTP